MKGSLGTKDISKTFLNHECVHLDAMMTQASNLSILLSYEYDGIYLQPVL